MAQPSVELLQALLKLERQIREAPDPEALAKVITVQGQSVLGFKDAVFYSGANANRMRPRAASNETIIDPSSPVLAWIEKLFELHSSQLDSGSSFVASEDSRSPVKNFLPKNVLFIPLHHSKHGLLGCIVFTKTANFSRKEIFLINHVAGTISHALGVFFKKPKQVLGLGITQLAAFISIVVFLLSVFPINLTALAPVEVVSYQPEIIKAPFDGVIEEITVEPFSKVGPGTLIARLNNYRLKAVYDDVVQKVLKAESRISSKQGKSVGQGPQSDLENLKTIMQKTEKRLLQTNIRAQSNGIAIIKSPGEWKGRLVKAGEKILEIADPREVEFVLKIPARHADLISHGSSVKVFLDRSPFSSLAASVVDTSLVPAKSDTPEKYYIFKASLGESQTPPHIGQKGIARIYGERSNLLFLIFRGQMKFAQTIFGL
ncbi:MAG TPA: hypothetical protein DCP12_04825 [Rhodobiaceae bacterium]|nr:hypothetical protein [Rhodobiaceae bacterium]